MQTSRDFNPNWVSAPGDTIRDILMERNILLLDFAALMKQSLEQIENILDGNAPITITTARRLSAVLGASVSFWMSRDFNYQEDKRRLRSEQEWLSELPIKDMVRFQWLRKAPPDSSMLLRSCLAYFGVTSVAEWSRRYERDLRIAFKQSMAFETRPAAIAAWLRQGEIESRKRKVAAWNREAFAGSLKTIRKLTQIKSPALFIPRLQQICAENGVACVFVLSPDGCRASGAARFVDRMPVLQFSFRHRADDQFWFTFFHEAAHLLLHIDDGIIVDNSDGDTERSPEECEADDFATNVLIPADLRRRLFAMRLNHKSIIRFAVEAGIAPGIVVGQLQHAARVRQDHFNGLKRYFAAEQLESLLIPE